MYCKHCHREFPDSYFYCTVCGSPLVKSKEPPRYNPGTSANTTSSQAPKKKNGFLRFLIFLLLIMIGYNYFAEREEVKRNSENASVYQSETTHQISFQEYNDASKKPLNEFFLESRYRGPCSRLTGPIGVLFLFVDDGESSWSQSEIQTFLADARTRLNDMEAEAARWGVKVHFYISHCQTAVSEIVDDQNRLVCKDTFLKNCSIDPQYAHNQIRNLISEKTSELIMEAFPAFVLNKVGRDFASAECIYLYRNADALNHEMSHIFGTSDYYYMNDVKSQAGRLLGEGIVYGGGDETRMDPLAAYLVGWTNTLSPEAEEFLDYVSQYTKGEWDTARTVDTFSGYGRKSTSEYVYEGDLLTGIMHGYGTVTWSDGDQYTGEFVDGQYSGTGTLIWANGNRYEGNFVDGQMHGYGTITWNNGDQYTGDYIDGKRTGTGTYFWANGSRYEGDFLDDQLHGWGVLYYANGSVRSGRWDTGNYLGQ